MTDEDVLVVESPKQINSGPVFQLIKNPYETTPSMLSTPEGKKSKELIIRLLNRFAKIHRCKPINIENELFNSSLEKIFQKNKSELNKFFSEKGNGDFVSNLVKLECAGIEIIRKINLSEFRLANIEISRQVLKRRILFVASIQYKSLSSRRGYCKLNHELQRDNISISL